MKGKASIIIFIATIYALVSALSFYLKIDFLLFFLATPWNVFITFLMAALIHESYNFDYFLLSGNVLNLILFLWFGLFKPALQKAGEIKD